MATVPEWAWIAGLAAAAFGTGILAGLTAGLLGVGGGIVIVPVLYYAFAVLGVDEHVRMHLAVGTSLSTIIPTSIVSARAHARRGAVDTRLLKSWAPAIFVGVIAGTAGGGVVRGDVLTAVFAVVALAVAAHMAYFPEGVRLRDGLPVGGGKAAIGLAIGGVSAMMGIGGGTLSVPILASCSYPIRRAVGTAAAIGLVIAIPGTIGFALFGLGVGQRPLGSIGYVNLIGFALLTPATMLAAPWGARIAHSVAPNTLRRVFALFLALTSLRMIYGLVGRAGAGSP